MLNQFVLPKPTDDSIFEDLVTDIFMRQFGTYNFQRYGKKGQKQFGVDSIGPIGDKLIGIQAKNHSEPGSKIAISEIDKEVKKSESFTPALSEYYVVTSADRDNDATSHVLALSKKREEQGKYPVQIRFWQDICNQLYDYPDLLYKYFTQSFPKQELEDLVNYEFAVNKKTKLWPLTKEEIMAHLQTNLHGAYITGTYSVAIGISSFSQVDFSGKVDIQVNISDDNEDSFITAANIFKDLKTKIADQHIAKEIIFFPQMRIAYAFLLGWIFRRVTGHQLTLSLKDNQVWRTHNMPYVEPRIKDEKPVFFEGNNGEVFVVLNISRNIQESVTRYIEEQSQKPWVMLGYSVEGNAIVTSAHALSVALYLSKKIKNLIDVWGAKHIHLFSAMPIGLAVLISYNLNAICPISLYYMDESRSRYLLTGKLTNNS